MSLPDSEAVWKHSKSKGTERLVLLAIADRINQKTGICWPQIKTIGQMTNCKERAVQRAIAKLVVLEELSVIPRGHEHRSNLYSITLPGASSPNEKALPKGVFGDTLRVSPVTRRVSLVADKGVRDDTPNWYESERNRNGSEANPETESEDSFKESSFDPRKSDPKGKPSSRDDDGSEPTPIPRPPSQLSEEEDWVQCYRHASKNSLGDRIPDPEDTPF